MRRYAEAFDWLVATALTATVFAFACGSTSENQFLVHGRPARWGCLLVLLGLSIVYAAAWWRLRVSRLGLPWTFLSLAGALVGLALVSTSWSVDAWLTFRRAGSLALLFAVGACLLAATQGRPEGVRRLLAGLLGGAVVVGVAGLIVLAFDHDAAVQPASTQYPARFQGFEQNPDTAALLFAVAIPIAVFLLLRARTWFTRAAMVATIVLFTGSVAASGSRGAMIGGLAGTLVVVLTAARGRRTRLVLVAATVAVFAACVGFSQIPQAKPAPPSTSGTPVIRRTLFTSSGRRSAWVGAIHQAEQRPVAGYGFGTEALVFVDRYFGFDSDLVENSYIGGALQLGLFGLALLLGVVGAALVPFIALGPRPGVGAACAGVVVAALVVAGAQSYLFSVGNIATGTAWICLFLLAGVVATSLPAAQRVASTSSERMLSKETAGAHSGSSKVSAPGW